MTPTPTTCLPSGDPIPLRFRAIPAIPLNECKIRIEHARAEANQELTETLNQHEAGDAGRFDRMQREYEKRYRDPDDVFFQAQQRHLEIKDQIRELQKGLARQRPTKKKQKRAGK